MNKRSRRSIVVVPAIIALGALIVDASVAYTASQQAQLKFIADPSKVDLNKIVSDGKVDGGHRASSLSVEPAAIYIGTAGMIGLGCAQCN